MTMHYPQSQQWFERAERSIVGGVNSPVRAFRGVGGTPIFMARAEGAYLYDVDGNQYIDYIGSWGPMILGHGDARVLAAVQSAMKDGVSFGAPTAIEVELAELVKQLMPNIELLRFVSSGTEAAMSAIRVARGFTGRDKIIKFSGCYHGHADGLLVRAGSGALTLGALTSKGVPADFAQHTLVASFNNLDEVAALFEKYDGDIAGVMVEPIAGNMNLVLPADGFLLGLRQLCDRYNSLLIFDEVMTGFRVGLSGAQGLYGIKPDLTVLGKIVGGGFPAAAFGGRRDVMSVVSPLGDVYQAGTLSGNPLAMAAGLATLSLLQSPDFYQHLSSFAQALTKGLADISERYGQPFFAQSIGGMFGLYFGEKATLKNEDDVKKLNVKQFQHFFHALLQRGVYFAPSMFEAGFVSAVHGKRELGLTLEKAEEVWSVVSAKGAIP